MTLGALDAGDTRTVDIRVAGPAALLVANVHKIGELRGTGTDKLATRFGRLLSDPRSAEVAKAGRVLFVTQFSKRADPGVQMRIRSAGVLADPDELLPVAFPQC